MLETLTQGGAKGSCPSLALGYDSVARTGLSEEPAASCRWTSRKCPNSRRGTAIQEITLRSEYASSPGCREALLKCKSGMP